MSTLPPPPAAQGNAWADSPAEILRRHKRKKEEEERRDRERRTQAMKKPSPTPMIERM